MVNLSVRKKEVGVVGRVGGRDRPRLEDFELLHRDGGKSGTNEKMSCRRTEGQSIRRFDSTTFRLNDVSTFRRFDVMTFRHSDVVIRTTSGQNSK